MSLAVRADASDEVGVGHLMRCCSVAERLGFPATGTLLVTASLTPRLRDTVLSWGWRVEEVGALSPAVDARTTAALLDRAGSIHALLLDHYGLGAPWEVTASDPCRLVLVIDDTGDRAHDCDLLIDPSIGAGATAAKLPPADGRPVVLLGPQFAPIDPRYDDVAPRTRTGLPRELLVFLGGAATGDDLLPLMAALSQPGASIERTTMVLGHAFSHRELAHRAAADVPGLTVIDSVPSMIPLQLSADLAIGAPGGAQWERCATGLPTLTVLTHPSQAADCAAFESAGATRHLGDLHSMTSERWVESLGAALRDPDRLTTMSIAAAALVGGRQDAWRDARATVMAMLPAVDGESS